MEFFYTVFGMQIRSEVKLDALMSSSKPETINVNIVKGQLSRPVDNLQDTFYNEHLILNPKFCFQDLETNGAFSIEKKEEIIEVRLDFRKTENPQTLLSFFYGTGLSSILQLYGRFAIHASGVVVNDRLNLFCGESGVGKSTLAASLKAKGYPFFTDDKCVLFKNRMNEKWMAHPSLRILRLWEESSKALNTDPFLENPKPVHLREKKYQYQVKKRDQIKTNVPLETLYILTVDESISKPEVHILSGVEKMKQLQRQIFRRYTIKWFKKDKALWDFVSELSKNTPVFLVKRPKNIQIDEMSVFMEKTISETKKTKG